ncbi:hypothetical protein [Natrinema caseinilyticum]|uniref:hypothetical protein n=1 Tax=Natrinema caseinilyticum TaxID=2961570 RepID=UPI0020C58A97|nr:hypothetical protein [Natrinema caseinilyticum]
MINRSSVAAVCLVIVVAVSLPAGAYSGRALSESITDAAFRQEDGEGDEAYSEMCIPPSPLENTTMNASRQTATNLRTQSATVSATGDGTTIKNDLITIESEYIEGSELCFDRLSTVNETMQIQLHDVQFVNTSIHGPWTDIEFRTGSADVMTVILPGEELLNVLRQTPSGRLLIDGIKDRYDLASAGNESAETGSDGPTDGTDDSMEQGSSSDEPTANESDPGAGGENTTPSTDGIGNTLKAIGDALEDVETTVRNAADTFENATGSGPGQNESASETTETETPSK